METETQPTAYSTETLEKPAAAPPNVPEDSGTEEDMAPPELDMIPHQNGGGGDHGRRALFSERLVSDEGETGEDGEILEDGELPSDEGERADGEVREGKSQSSSPSKKGHKDDRDRHGRNKRDRHSKRRRSKEDGHRDKQTKKKRHREYVDYDKAGDDGTAAPPWASPDKRDKGERKGDRSPPVPYSSPGHDSHGEGEKHRRGSGESRHHGSRKDRTRDKDRNRDSRDRSRDRQLKDKKDNKKDKPEKEKKDRDRGDRHKDSRSDKPSFPHNDGYESPPGIYDSPSDDEFDGFGGKKPKTMMSMVEGDYMDPALAASDIGNEPMLPKNQQQPGGNKKKLQKKKEWQERMRQRERDREFDEDAAPPPKKKPLLQTPMEERPVCKFFLEGKCQKGVNCLFRHDHKGLPKRLELCRFHIKSYCRQEDECPYMHSEFPCKYFHTGQTCYQGDNCKFSHDPLTAETEEALRLALHENEDGDHFDQGFENRKHKKKGLLGDQPMSEEEIHHRLEEMKKIPSIFDIETFAPGESPSKPPKQQAQQQQQGQSPSGNKPQGFYQDANMSPQTGGNMRFNGPPNQPPPFMPGTNGPNMDGPPPGMPPMMGPPPGMGPQGPGMQGVPLGPPPNMNNPPMSQAAAFVGALLRAAPMLQQYRGPGQPPPTSMANSMGGDGMFMGGPPNMSVPPPNMSGQGMPVSMSSPGQDSMQGNQALEGFSPDSMQQQQNQSGIPANVRDPRRGMVGAPNDPRRNRGDADPKQQDVDMRGAVGGDDGSSSPTLVEMGDVDLRQDVDMRQEDAKANTGNTTPQQDWDDDNDAENEAVDDSDIPAHLPPKQREMFLRIKQHGLKMGAQNTGTGGQDQEQREAAAQPKADDDKWYSSDEEDDEKPDISNVLKNLNQNEIKQEAGATAPTSVASSINVMQMINAIKSSTPADAPTQPGRPADPRIKAEPVREPTTIVSQDGDCPWRLCRVLYTKQRIPQNLNTADAKYKNDPRIQKILKLQELESGVLIDHSKTVKTSMVVKTEPGEQKPNLLDPKILQKQTSLPRPELAPFVDPRKANKGENVDPRVKQEPVVPRQQDPRMKPNDPRMAKMAATHNLPVKPMDPRLARQDSNSASSAMGAMGRATDPRLARQNSREPELHRSGTPPMDPRQMNSGIPSLDPRQLNSGIPSLDPRQLNSGIPSLDPRQLNSGIPSLDPRQLNSGIPSLDPRQLNSGIASMDLRQNNSGVSPMDPRQLNTGVSSMDPRQLNRQSSGDPRLQRTESTTPFSNSVNVTKPLDPRLGRVIDSEIGPPSISRQMSQPGTTSEKDAASTNPQKPKLDYRNDPRFKRKPISESNLPPETLGKRFTGQRKGSTEYSSPLGDDAVSEESGYNSYNRPRPPVKSQLPSQNTSFSSPSDSASGAGLADVTTHDILDSIEIMPPPALEPTQGPDKNLKDVFKMIDPTASPFC